MSRIVRMRESLHAVDSIADPLQLGHALCALQSETEEHIYHQYIRGSSASKICIRDRILGWRNNLLKTNRISVSERLIYDVGNAYHRWMQNSPVYFGDRRVGWWKCLYCKNRYFGKAPKQKCSCGMSPEGIIYDEHEMVLNGDPAYVGGHPDMFLEIENNDIRVAEIKSMKGDEWKTLKFPLAENVFQLHTYFCFLPYDSNLPIRVNHLRGFLFYVNKNPGREFPIKAFNIVRQETIVQTIMSDMLSHKRGIEDETYIPPVEQACLSSSWSNYRAKSCPSLHLCRQSTAKEG
jgi:hypothetical protein